MAEEMKPILVPELIWLAEVKGESEPVGFILCVPDINVASQNKKRSPNDIWFADRPGEIALLQESHQNGAGGGDGRGAEISAARRRGNAGLTDH